MTGATMRSGYANGADALVCDLLCSKMFSIQQVHCFGFGKLVRITINSMKSLKLYCLGGSMGSLMRKLQGGWLEMAGGTRDRIGLSP